MAFKNALKILVSKFGLVWIILLYGITVFALLFAISLPFSLPLLSSIKDAGIGGHFNILFDSVLSGETLPVLFEKIHDIMLALKNMFITDTSAVVNVVMLLVLVLGVFFRFFIGLYEIPLTNVLEGNMSSNARIGFMSCFISKLGKSVKFNLSKMMYTLAYDGLLYLFIFNLFDMFNISFLKWFAPFIIMVVFLVLIALRYSVIAMWAPSIVVGQHKIFDGFGFGIKRTFKNFGSVFSTFIIAWTLIIAFNIIVGLFTFCAGLLITVPLSMLLINIINMTIYYSKNNRRYYVDNTVITPPETK